MGSPARVRRSIAVLAAVLVLGASSPAAGQAATYRPTADRAAVDSFVPYSVTRNVAPAHPARVLTMRTQAARVAQARVDRAAVLKVARAQIGDPYVAGSAGPNGFDCGGLVQFVFRKAIGKELLRSSRQQYTQVQKIKRKNAQPGDLVFFFERGAHHVGIYIGNGKMIDAPRRGERVRVSPIDESWWSRTYTGMGRVLPAV